MATWTHSEVRAWIRRHGGNVSRLAGRLGVRRQTLQAWAADPSEATSARPLPRYIQSHMQTLDES